MIIAIQQNTGSKSGHAIKGQIAWRRCHVKSSGGRSHVKKCRNYRRHDQRHNIATFELGNERFRVDHVMEKSSQSRNSQDSESPIPAQRTLALVNTYVVHTTQLLNDFAIAAETRLQDIRLRLAQTDTEL